MNKQNIVKFLDWYHDPERGMSLETDHDDIAGIYLNFISPEPEEEAQCPWCEGDVCSGSNGKGTYTSKPQDKLDAKKFLNDKGIATPSIEAVRLPDKNMKEHRLIDLFNEFASLQDNPIKINEFDSPEFNDTAHKLYQEIVKCYTHHDGEDWQQGVAEIVEFVKKHTPINTEKGVKPEKECKTCVGECINREKESTKEGLSEETIAKLWFKNASHDSRVGQIMRFIAFRKAISSLSIGNNTKDKDYNKDQLIGGLEYLLADWSIKADAKKSIVQRYSEYIDKIENGENVV